MLIQANFILVDILVIVGGISRVLRLLLLVCQVGIVLVSFLQFALLLQIDNLRVVDTDGAFECLGSHNFVDEVHGLCRKLDALDRLLFGQIWVKETNSVRIFVRESACGHHINGIACRAVLKLSFGADRYLISLVESRTSHRSLRLLLLES